jgi:hypothetical protein
VLGLRRWRVEHPALLGTRGGLQSAYSACERREVAQGQGQGAASLNTTSGAMSRPGGPPPDFNWDAMGQVSQLEQENSRLRMALEQREREVDSLRCAPPPHARTHPSPVHSLLAVTLSPTRTKPTAA